jgi:hypothetical protein
VLDLLRGDPELLAIADAIASTQLLERGEALDNATDTRCWRRLLRPLQQRRHY